MADRPVIAIVDDEPAALAAMLDALNRRFGAPPSAAVPAIAIHQPDPGSYDHLLAGAWTVRQDTA